MGIFATSRAVAAWTVARFDIRNERGATAVEYGIMVSLIAAVIIVAVIFLGKRTSSTFSCTGETMESQAASC